MGKNNITRLYKDPNVEKQLNKANEKYFIKQNIYIRTMQYTILN